MNNVTRNQIVLHEIQIIDFEERIPFSGLALFMHNSGNDDVDISIQGSDNGTDWNNVTFSTLTAAAETTFDLVHLSQGVIIFSSIYRYIRITCADRSTAGIYINVIGFEGPDMDI